MERVALLRRFEYTAGAQVWKLQETQCAYSKNEVSLKLTAG
jgi:hypothetical protein